MPQRYKEDGVKEERTGWRDSALSERHRLWGFDCPMVDIDFLVIEYDRSVPKALIEYKHHLAPRVALDEPNYAALRIVADRTSVPFYVVRYWTGPYRFSVSPANAEAALSLPNGSKMTELEYVRWLYTLRGRVMPGALERKLA